MTNIFDTSNISQIYLTNEVNRKLKIIDGVVLQHNAENISLSDLGISYCQFKYEYLSEDGRLKKLFDTGKISYTYDIGNEEILCIGPIQRLIRTSEVKEIENKKFINEQELQQIDNSYLARIGESTYSTLQHFFNAALSAGWSSGGEITDAGGGTINVAAGTGFIKTEDTDSANLKFFDWDQATELLIPNNTRRYVGVKYNSGSVAVVLKTSDDWDNDTEFPLGCAVNEDGFIFAKDIPWAIADNATNVIERFDGIARITRDERFGGLILNNTGTRNLSVSEGQLLSRMSEFVITEINTSSGGNFTSYYRNGSGGWSKQVNQTQWNNTKYDNGTGTLSNLTSSYYTSRWVYLMTDNTLAIIYGQTEYATSAEALNDTTPSSVPERIECMGLLIGRIIAQQGTNTPSAVQSSFGISFTGSSVTSHKNLSDVGENTHEQIDNFIEQDFVYETRTINGHDLSSNVTITKSDVGLGNIDNTSDIDKPVSTAQQTALDNIALSISARVQSPVGDLTAIKAINTTSPSSYPDKTTILVENLGTYRLDRDSSATGDDNRIIEPTVGVGRWFKMTASIDDHNNTTNIQGGTTGEYYHLTSAQRTIVQNTSGVNTGDQDLSGLMVKANNLSDLTNTATARINIGLGNVDNTSDSTKNSAVAVLTNKTISGSNNTITDIQGNSITQSAAFNFVSSAQLTKINNIAVGATVSGVNTGDQTIAQLSPLTTKGDLLVYSTVNTRFPVGSNGQKIVADSNQATGLKYENKFYSTLGTDPATNLGNRRVTNIGAAGTQNFSFRFPKDFNQLVSLTLNIIPVATVANANIDLTSEYGKIGESPTLNTETNTTSTYSLVAGVLFGIDLTTVFTNPEAGDDAGLKVTNSGVTSGYNCTGIVMEYR